MIFDSPLCKGIKFDDFEIDNVPLPVVKVYKYLGHLISNDLKDSEDIKRQRASIYAKGNSLIRKFKYCSVEIRKVLFNSFITPMYTSHLWWNFRREDMRQLTVAYHTVLKILLGFSKYDSNSYICTVFNIRNCEATLRNFIYKFIVRTENSCNCIIQGINNSSLRYTSRIRKYWHRSLYTMFM